MERKPCDVCGQPLKRHDYGAGIPICPGIYAPGYRSTLNDKIAEQAVTIERLSAELERRQWQPIETAPRDGTNILAIVSGNHPDSGEAFTPEVVFWRIDQWWNDCWGYDSTDYEPTHWMPLPEPPAALTEKEG
jgi:hypothetical protein